MIRSSRAPLVLGALALTAACGGTSGDGDVFTAEDRALFRAMSLDVKATPPVDVSNEALATVLPSRRVRLAKLGQQLFFDRGLSSNSPDGRTVACVDCHEPTHWFSDPRAATQTSLGLRWTSRNSPSLVNVGYYVSFGWDGRADALWAQNKHAFESSATMGGERLHLVREIARRYADRWTDVFTERLPADLAEPGPNRFDVPMDLDAQRLVDATYRKALQAWGAYLLQLTSGQAPFDHFAAGDDAALSSSQKRGLRLFFGKAGCVSCHLGPHFTDNRFHALGLPQDGPTLPAVDLGRFTGLTELRKEEFAPYRLSLPPAPTDADKGRFRTKSLRHVAESGPYFHGGQARSLADVVWFYAQGGGGRGEGPVSPLLIPLDLNELEQADLVAFLGALTGEPVPAEWRCDPARHEDAGVVLNQCGSP